MFRQSVLKAGRSIGKTGPNSLFTRSTKALIHPIYSPQVRNEAHDLSISMNFTMEERRLKHFVKELQDDGAQLISKTPLTETYYDSVPPKQRVVPDSPQRFGAIPSRQNTPPAEPKVPGANPRVRIAKRDIVPDYVLSKRDTWLVNDDAGVWHMIAPVEDTHGRTHLDVPKKYRIPLYKEFIGEREIRRELSLQQDETQEVLHGIPLLDFKSDLERRMNIVPFASYRIMRYKFRIPIYLDGTVSGEYTMAGRDEVLKELEEKIDEDDSEKKTISLLQPENYDPNVKPVNILMKQMDEAMVNKYKATSDAEKQKLDKEIEEIKEKLKQSARVFNNKVFNNNEKIDISDMSHEEIFKTAQDAPTFDPNDKEGINVELLTAREPSIERQYSTFEHMTQKDVEQGLSPLFQAADDNMDQQREANRQNLINALSGDFGDASPMIVQELVKLSPTQLEIYVNDRGSLNNVDTIEKKIREKLEQVKKSGVIQEALEEMIQTEVDEKRQNPTKLVGVYRLLTEWAANQGMSEEQIKRGSEAWFGLLNAPSMQELSDEAKFALQEIIRDDIMESHPTSTAEKEEEGDDQPNQEWADFENDSEDSEEEKKQPKSLFNSKNQSKADYMESNQINETFGVDRWVEMTLDRSEFGYIYGYLSTNMEVDESEERETHLTILNSLQKRYELNTIMHNPTIVEYLLRHRPVHMRTLYAYGVAFRPDKDDKDATDAAAEIDREMEEKGKQEVVNPRSEDKKDDYSKFGDFDQVLYDTLYEAVDESNIGKEDEQSGNQKNDQRGNQRNDQRGNRRK